MKAYQKIGKFSEVISYFAMRQWKFTNKNTQDLFRKMNARDRDLFNFNMAAFNWETYFYTYARGCRVYLLKDPMETLPAGRIKYRKLQIAHYTLVTFLCYVFYKMLAFFLAIVSRKFLV